MKKIFVLIYALFAFNVNAQQIKINKIYVPIGFDDNDNIEITIEGELPNVCWELQKAKIYKNGNFIEIKQYAIKKRDICTDTIVSFEKTITIGKLDEGTYQISGAESINKIFQDKNVKTLEVVKAETKDIDNFIYAPVQKIVIQKGVLAIKGEFYDSCTELERMVIDIQEDVIVFLPITKKLNFFCLQYINPFNFKINLEDLGIEGKYLLHIRSMKGKSLNKIQYIDYNSATHFE